MLSQDYRRGPASGNWYVARVSALGRIASAAVTVVVATGLGGCGGGNSGQGERRPVRLDVTQAVFPEHQQLSQQAQMQITVRNPGDQPVEQVVVSVTSTAPGASGSGFSDRSGGAATSDPVRPIWILDEGPHNAETADSAVWWLGPLAGGQSLTFTWKVTAVRAGPFELRWTVGGNLDGSLEGEGADGKPLTGLFPVTIKAKS